MRGSTVQYLQKEQYTVSVRNNNTSLAILDGQPVYLDNNNVTSVNLGVDVKNRSGALGSSPTAFFAGIVKCQAAAGLAVGEVGEAVCYGFTDAIVTRRSRAATTDTWDTVPTFGAGNQLVGETTGNNLIHLGPIPQTEAIPSGSTGQTVTLVAPVFVIAGESAASLPTTASSYGSGLVDTIRMKVFVRVM